VEARFRWIKSPASRRPNNLAQGKPSEALAQPWEQEAKNNQSPNGAARIPLIMSPPWGFDPQTKSIPKAAPRSASGFAGLALGYGMWPL
jgi:hypothetical protein